MFKEVLANFLELLYNLCKPFVAIRLFEIWFWFPDVYFKLVALALNLDNIKLYSMSSR